MLDYAGGVRRAARTLREHGWCQHDTADGPKRCAGGALTDAFGITRPDQTLPVAVMDAVNEVAREQYPERCGRVPLSGGYLSETVNFNDHRDTRVADVIAVLEKAAVRLEEATWPLGPRTG